MFLRVDPTLDRPLFEQIAAGIRAQVASGALAEGDRLPAARELGTSLDLHYHTVLHAYQVLRDEGLLELRRGRGAVVTGRALAYTQLADQARQIAETARRAGVASEVTASLVREAFAR